MRTCVACASCRLAKVKCVHNGTAPCERCVKSGNTACALVQTRQLIPANNRKKKRRRQEAVTVTCTSLVANSASNHDNEYHDQNNNGDSDGESIGINNNINNNRNNGTTTDNDGNMTCHSDSLPRDGEPSDPLLTTQQQAAPVVTPTTTARAAVATPSNGPHDLPVEHQSRQSITASDETVSDSRVESHLASLHSSLIVQVVTSFNVRYPELAMVHLPTLLRQAKSLYERRRQSHNPGSEGYEEYNALLASILIAYTTTQGKLEHQSSRDLYDSKVYEAYAERMLSKLTFASPHVQVVQALLILAVLKSSCFELHKAWMYCGSAIRMMQLCYSIRRAAPHASSLSDLGEDLYRVIEARTFWVCFHISCIINLGTSAQPLLTLQEMERMDLGHPLNSVQFALITDSRNPDDSLPVEQNPNQLWNAGDSFEIISRGIFVWNKAMNFIRNDGRRAPGMCRTENCPWSTTSPWSSIRENLERWRARQHPALYYPKHSVAAHSAIGNSENFMFINIIYYLSIILIHREYFPFLPLNEPEARGPIECRLEAPAPPGWWLSSAESLFGAASSIAQLLDEASACGARLGSPLAGFAAFIAAYMNLYVTQFPQMNSGHSTRSTHDFELCCKYLDNFRQTWPLGEGWIKTIQSASLLYSRCTSGDSRWLTKGSGDFSTLHQSIHDFFGTDKSQQHLQEIDKATTSFGDVRDICFSGMESELAEQSAVFSSLFFDLGGEFDTHDFWPS